MRVNANTWDEANAVAEYRGTDYRGAKKYRVQTRMGVSWDVECLPSNEPDWLVAIIRPLGRKTIAGLGVVPANRDNRKTGCDVIYALQSALSAFAKEVI